MISALGAVWRGAGTRAAASLTNTKFYFWRHNLDLSICLLSCACYKLVFQIRCTANNYHQRQGGSSGMGNFINDITNRIVVPASRTRFLTMSHAPVRRREFPALVTICCFALFMDLTEQGRLPGPLVYVVTPAPATRHVQVNAAPNRGAYYYNNWRRNDGPSSTTTSHPAGTHDLIFADFASDAGADSKKSVRKLLERERVNVTTTTTTTTESPDLIFADFESGQHREKSIKNLLKKERVNADSYPKLPVSNSNVHVDGLNEAYNDIYKNPVPTAPAEDSTTEDEPAETTLAPMKVEDIWHVINNEKQQEDVGGWEQLYSEDSTTPYGSTTDDNQADTQPPTLASSTPDSYSDNFVFPGFNSNNDKSTENESRAIRTESNYRFPYVNLKTYQMKTKPLPYGKKNNNVYTNVDNFRDVSQPVRGEVQDTAHLPMTGPIDRYNPAQPYLPPSPYGSTNKQSAPAPVPAKTPNKAVANLIPPPPPPPPSAAPGDFPPLPDSYESFPPYAPPPPPPSPPRPVSAPAPAFRPPLLSPPDVSGSQSEDNSGPPDSDSYEYKPVITSGGGYSYKTPSTGGGYSYKPPSSGGGYSYNGPVPPLAPPSEDDSGPPSKDSDDSAPPSGDDGPPPAKPDFNGYSYNKPHGHHHAHAHDDDDADYPELIYNKPQPPPMPPMKGDDSKGMDMMPPPPPPADMGMGDAKPDFPNLMFPHDDDGYKYHHHDFDFDNYHHHHHHHTTTTTTTTTEMPRVNRFSYYYLGKKLYYLPLYFSVYFVVYVAALIIKAVLRHKIVYPNSWQPYSGAAAVSRSERSTTGDEGASLSAERLHELTRLVTNSLMKAAEKYTATTTVEQK